MTEKINIERKRGNTRRLVFHLEYEGTVVPIDNFSNFKLTVDTDLYPADSTNNLEIMTGYIISAPEGILGFTPSG